MAVRIVISSRALWVCKKADDSRTTRDAEISNIDPRIVRSGLHTTNKERAEPVEIHCVQPPVTDLLLYVSDYFLKLRVTLRTHGSERGGIF